MEGVRSVLACITGHRGRHEEGYTELFYDDKMASLYSDDKMGALYSDDEPYPQHDAMDYYYSHHNHGYGTTTPAPLTANNTTYRGNRNVDTRSVEDIAREVAALLWQAEWNDDELQCRISDAVGDRRWSRKMVEECLDNVIEYVEQGRGAGMGPAMCAALDRATDVADDEFAFPRRHPPSLDGFIAIVSAGLLAELQGAWVLELLGFGEVRGKEEVEEGTGEIAMLTSDKIVYCDRPRPNSFAAWWTREYGAYIPTGSVYAYFKRMDMLELDD